MAGLFILFSEANTEESSQTETHTHIVPSFPLFKLFHLLTLIPYQISVTENVTQGKNRKTNHFALPEDERRDRKIDTIHFCSIFGILCLK